MSVGAVQEEHNSKAHELILPLILSVMGCIALALALTWLNIERTKLAYTARELQREANLRNDLHSNLLVERENLLSPHALGTRAEALGLVTAKPGQVRRMNTNGTLQY